MNRLWPLVHVIRLRLQTETAVSVTAGAADGSDDLRLALAPNGLPCLPATGLAGVLQAQVRSRRPDLVDGIFGWVQGQQGAESRLQIESGVMHDSRDRPVQSWPSAGLNDTLVAPWLLQPPPIRRRNAGGHRGATLKGAHFDRPFVPAGTRFTLDIRLWGHDATRLDEEEALLVSLFHGAGLRIGGATRSGMGRVSALDFLQRRFDLRLRPDLADYVKWMHESNTSVLRHGSTISQAPAAPHWGACTLDAVSDGPFRVGGGSHSLAGTQGDVPDDLPFVEQRVRWKPQAAGLCGSLDWVVVVPFSAIKGALSHRVAFHDHRLRDNWATAERAAPADIRSTSPAVLAWFGQAGGRDSGHAGALFGDDCIIPGEVAVKHLGRAHRHQSDRFTASPMPHLLFNAENLYKVPLKWRIDVDFAHAKNHGADDKALQALDLALEDLAQGRLAIGADDAIGLGVLKPGAHMAKQCWQLPLPEHASVAIEEHHP